ncbi:MAG: HAD family phosphatase [Selenomonadaceae bacterium]|nr:HAD family phosphatase [Selenomonadaceae bacterium]
MVKLFVSDLDGTMVISGKNPSEKNIAAVQKMINAGITVTVATGRMYRAALPIAKALGIEFPIITYNGALIKSVKGEILHSDYFPTDLLLAVTKFFEKNNWYVHNYSDDELFIPFRSPFTEWYETTQRVQAQIIGWEGMLQKTERVCKLLAINESAEENMRREKMLLAEFEGKIEITKSHPRIMEIMLPGVSKAAAIKILAQKLGIERSEVMAIGDSDNDLAMLQAAGQSIAMGNATDEVKKSCNFLTTGCEEDGVAYAVEKFVLGGSAE